MILFAHGTHVLT